MSRELPDNVPKVLREDFLNSVARAQEFDLDVVVEKAICTEDLMLVSVPNKGTCFLCILINDEDSTIFDIQDPFRDQYTSENLFRARIKGIQPIESLGFTKDTWQLQYGEQDWMFENIPDL